MDTEENSLKIENFKLPHGFCLENFIEVYVHEALRKAKEDPSMDEFDEEIRGIVSSRIGVSRDLVRYLHHAFHWEFFNKNNGSLLEYIQAENPAEKNYVHLKRNYTVHDVEKMASTVLENQWDILQGRLSSLLKDF